MCGILGVVSSTKVKNILVDGLKRLEYRGYDSSGIAVLDSNEIKRRRAKGKIRNLESVLEDSPVNGHIGIGHTRWATHGVASEENAHPHMTDKVAVVHNGIIENYKELVAEVKNNKNYDFKLESETDTEIIVHLLTIELENGKTPQQAVENLLPKLHGAFALCMIFKNHDNFMIGTRRGSPLAIGFASDEIYFGSDSLALAPFVRDICYLDDGDYAVVNGSSYEIFDENNQSVKRDIVKTNITGASIGKGVYDHFMMKEIKEQPEAIANTISSLINLNDNEVVLPPLDFDAKKIEKIVISACGTAYYAGMIGKYWLERIGNMPVEIDVASELRYRTIPGNNENNLGIFISQSGETMDTIEALKFCKNKGMSILSILNIDESTIERLSDSCIKTHAGPEIGVASTKAFTTQLTIFATLAIYFGMEKGNITKQQNDEYVKELLHIPDCILEVFKSEEKYKEIGKKLSQYNNVIFIGRGHNYPTALEGALKLKEISYIHAEGYAAGELKHGPIALIDEKMPIIAICPYDNLFEKTFNNVQEISSRGGRILFLSDKKGIESLKQSSMEKVEYIELPEVGEISSPLIYSIPMQLISYYTALAKGTDIDQPRNLAKSVTVE